MTTLVVTGGKPLNGRVRVGGNKNAALPVIAACLLTDEECVLENVPRIRDVEVMAELLRALGATVKWEGVSTLRIRAPTSRRPSHARTWSPNFAAPCSFSARCWRARGKPSSARPAAISPRGAI